MKGTVFNVDANGALVDVTAKSSAFLPIREACIHGIKHVEEAGIVPGMRDEFIIIGENEHDDSLILSSRQIQYDLAWERCRQLQAEDVVLKGKVRCPKNKKSLFISYNTYSRQTSFIHVTLNGNVLMINLLFFFPHVFVKVVGANKGGVVAIVEGLRGFVPFSQISSVCFHIFLPSIF